MRIIPVLDLLGSRVVRGVAGRRDQYAPLVSRLVEGCDPLAVAQAIRNEFDLRQFYVADLDAILSWQPNRPILRQLAAEGFSLLVDAGVRRAADAGPIFDLDVDHVVVGLETLESPADLSPFIERHGSERILFSLDLRDGRPLASAPEWSSAEPFEIARWAIEAGCRQFIVLDIAGVGTGGGVPTLPLCEQIRNAFLEVTLFTGGGVRNVHDLQTLERAGIDGALVASALHDGSITPRDLASLAEHGSRQQ
jgi:phosphoribosylformimino-5-aminoimidazole carboxamide ribotide isomerase